MSFELAERPAEREEKEKQDRVIVGQLRVVEAPKAKITGSTLKTKGDK